MIRVSYRISWDLQLRSLNVAGTTAPGCVRHASCKCRVTSLITRGRLHGAFKIRVLFATTTNMAFDLNKDWSISDVSSLLGSVEDDRSWRLEVTSDGLAQLNDMSTIPGAAYVAQLHCFFEICGPGDGFRGSGRGGRHEPLQKARSHFAGELPRAHRAKDAYGALGRGAA